MDPTIYDTHFSKPAQRAKKLNSNFVSNSVCRATRFWCLFFISYFPLPSSSPIRFHSFASSDHCCHYYFEEIIYNIIGQTERHARLKLACGPHKFHVFVESWFAIHSRPHRMSINLWTSLYLLYVLFIFPYSYLRFYSSIW